MSANNAVKRRAKQRLLSTPLVAAPPLTAGVRRDGCICGGTQYETGQRCGQEANGLDMGDLDFLSSFCRLDNFIFWSDLFGDDIDKSCTRAYLESLSSFDVGITVLIGLLNVSAAVALFALNRMALNLFVAAFVASLLVAVWHVVTKGWLEALGGPGFIGTVIGYSVSLAVCLYTWKLTKRGALA